METQDKMGKPGDGWHKKVANYKLEWEMQGSERMEKHEENEIR